MTKKPTINEVQCNMCGDVYYYEGKFNGQVAKNEEEVGMLQDWVHEINLSGIGYGSIFDMSKVTFHICDDCMEEIFKDMEIKPYIHSDFPHTHDRRIQKIEKFADESIEEMDEKKFYELFQKFTLERFK